MKHKGITGHGDLARLGDKDRIEALAYLFGYDAVEVAEAREETSGGAIGEPESRAVRVIDRPLSPASFWYPARFEAIGASPVPQDGGTGTKFPQWPRPELKNTVPEFRPLAPWRDLGNRLRTVLDGDANSRTLDMEAIVERMSEGEVLTRLPYKPLSRWTEGVQIIADRSRRLTPLFDDQRYVAHAIRRLVPDHGLLRAAFRERTGKLVSFVGEGEEADYRMPPPGMPVLVLGDLGSLAHSREAQGFWLDFGRRLHMADCRPVALFPPQPRECPRELASVWTIVPWQRPRPGRSGSAGAVRAHRLLRLASAASRIEPGLLRALRLLLPRGEADAGTEIDVWRHAWFSSDSPAAATIRPDRVGQLREEFAEHESDDLRRRVSETIRRWRFNLPMEIWFDELLNMDSAARSSVPDSDIRDAQDYHRAFASELGDVSAISGADRAWRHRSAARATLHYWNDEKVGRIMMRLDYDLNKHKLEYQPPAAFDPDVVEAPPGTPVTELIVSHIGKDLHLQEMLEDRKPLHGSSLATVRTRNRIVKVEPRAFWKSGVPPTWAVDWGYDEYGAWSAFQIEAVTQRLRWIPPGQFTMGSPEDERGRFDNEGPCHGVTTGHGYWLFDTPVTQALWQSVMGENPSKFNSEERPVEHVSWQDAHSFIDCVNILKPGLSLSLPSEAQWEYACRAGSSGAIFEGDLELLGERNAPALDGIAWYGGNSGVDYDLNEGEDSSDWLEKQYPHQRAGTYAVGLKRPNGWGLYDMLGNVWEWCDDTWHEDYNDAPLDDSVWIDDTASAARVVRGGSWYAVARFVRSACRYRFHPEFQYNFIGFRCARVHKSQTEGRTADPSEPVAGWQAERRPAGSGKTFSLETEHTTWRLPHRAGFCVRTDSERVFFGYHEKPRWASGMGRDEFGLWAEIQIGEGQAPETTQRMRWIPPGRFTMGSPVGEPGRRNSEGPCHEVTIEQGYWLFDTPVTQGLWQALMEENPSEYKSAARPVEQVSWADAQAFIERINTRVPSLGLSLPSEAQWEYACRTGRRGAIYEGEFELLGERNAPALDVIAWYGGNSGVSFDLEDGYDSSGWREKQYPHEVAGTRAAGLKRPNGWGLYDMLGNVWEWCEDTWHEDYDGAPMDGSAWEDEKASAYRVVRGGSWRDFARLVRPACRGWLLPEYRNGNIGFRCTRVQE